MQREFVFDLVSSIGSFRLGLGLGLGMPSEHFYPTRKHNLGLETARSCLEPGPVWSEQCFMFSSVWHDSSNFKYGKYFINVRTRKEHIIISGSFDAAQNQLFFLSTQWFSSKNSTILILNFSIFSFPARIPEFASKHESQQEESALRLALLRPWSQHHDPLLPHLPPADRLEVLLHQRLLRSPLCRWDKGRRWSLQGRNLLTLIETFLRVVAAQSLPWEMRGCLLLSGDDTTRSP